MDHLSCVLNLIRTHNDALRRLGQPGPPPATTSAQPDEDGYWDDDDIPF